MRIESSWPKNLVFTFIFLIIVSSPTLSCSMKMPEDTLSKEQLPILFEEEEVSNSGTHLYTEWFVGDVLFFRRDIISGLPLKFDILRNEILVRIGPNQMVAIDGLLVREFRWKNSLQKRMQTFVNAIPFTQESFVQGFYEIVYDGDVKLLKRYFLETEKENQKISKYDVVLFDPRLADPVKSNSLALEKEKRIYPLSGGKKQWLAVFGGYADEISSFMKKERVKARSEKEVIAILKHYEKIRQ